MSRQAPAIGQDRELTWAYCAAHFGKSLFWNCGALLLAFFLTEVAGLSPMVMGMVLGGGLLVSAAADVVIGRVFRGALSGATSAAALQVWGCVFTSLALLALFAVPLAPVDVRFECVVAALLAFRISYGVYDTPQNALMTLATRDAPSRSRVAALRVAVSGLAALFLGAVILPFLASDAFSSSAQRIALFAALGLGMAAIGLVTALWLGRGVASVEFAPRSMAAPSSAQAARPGAWSQITALSPLYGMAFAFPFAMSAFAKLEPYYVAYVVNSPAWAGALATAGASGVLLSQLAWARVLKGIGRREALTVLSAGLLVGALVFGLTAQTPWAATLTAGLIGVVSGGLSILIWATVADEAAAGDRSQVGLIYGVFTAASKTAPAVSGASLGVLLGRFDYRVENGDDLILLMAGFPVVGALVCIMIALCWRTREPI